MTKPHFSIVPLNRRRLSCAVFVAGHLALAACASADEKPLELTVSVRPTGASWQLVTLDVAGKSRRVLIEEPQDLNFPAWSPDGRQLAFVSGKKGSPQIHRIDADGGRRVALTDTTAMEIHPRWSADGKTIFFASQRTGDFDIWSIDADGANPLNLTKQPSFDSDPAPSPDGKLVVFASNRRPNGGLGPFHLWAIKPDGGEPKQLVSRDLFGWIYPSWSPDATQIVFSDRTADGSWQVFAASVEGGSVEQLTEGTGGNAYASWSPDGRYIAYLHFEKPLNQSPDVGRLMLYDTETLVHRRLGADDLRCQGSWPAWRPSGE